jgi:hypothetical protein
MGVEWMLAAMDAREDLHVVAHLVNVDPLTRVLLERTRGSERLHVEDRRALRRTWREAWASITVADLGIVVYHQGAPHFQQMGLCSNRLCMFLAMGVPVIASRQPSFEFLEKYDCGLLVESEEQFIQAIESIGERLPEMRRNAFRCAREYIDAPGRYGWLRETLREVLR